MNQDFKQMLNDVYKLATARMVANPSETICSSMRMLMINKQITPETYDRVVEHFRTQRPTTELHPEFYFHYTYQKDLSTSLWWRNDDFKTGDVEIIFMRTQRILFLAKLIEITK